MSKEIRDYQLEPKKVLVPIKDKKFNFAMCIETELTVENIIDVIPSLILYAGMECNQKHYKKTRQELLDSVDVCTCLVELRTLIANRESSKKATQNNCKLMFPDDLKIITERVLKELEDNFGTEYCK